MRTTPLPELTPVLKQLRLSGILDSLETRNREAIAKKLSYPEFLALVIQDDRDGLPVSDVDADVLADLGKE